MNNDAQAESDKKPVRRRTTRAKKQPHEGAAEAVAESLTALTGKANAEEPQQAEKPARSRGSRQKKSAESPSVAAEFSEKPAEVKSDKPQALPATFLLFQEPDPTSVVRRVADEDEEEKKPRRRGSRGKGKSEEIDQAEEPKEDGRGSRAKKKPLEQSDEQDKADSSEKKSEKKDSGQQNKKSDQNSKKQDQAESDSEKKNESKNDSSNESSDETPTTRRRRRRRSSESASEEVSSVKGSTRLEAKRQRRREGREAGRKRVTVTEAEFLARRESVDRTMLVREQNGLNQIAVIEDGILVEHYVARHTQVSMVGNVYLGRVQNVLPSMEAAFVDIGKGRNAVLYAGEVNWDAAGMEGKPRRIEQALKSGDTVLVQVTKDPIGHKGARLTGQVTLAGRHLVFVPNGSMTGISRKLPENERNRLKKLLREIVPSEHGVIVRTAAEGASEAQLRGDVERLTAKWAEIQEKAKKTKAAPTLLKGEPELAVRVVRDVFNEDFAKLEIQGKKTYETIKDYVHELSPELDDRVHHWVKNSDIFADNRVDEQLAKAMDRKVFLPSGGSLVIDRTEAMTVIDVNTGKFTGSGGTLEETVTKNNLEAAEEIVRQLRLRDIGGIIVVDFIDMVLESNRDLVLRRLIESLGRDRTRHQVAEVTSLGLVQMTRKRVGQGLVEAFSTTCECCEGRGFITHTDPVEKGDEPKQNQNQNAQQSKKQNQSAQNSTSNQQASQPAPSKEEEAKREEVRAALASIAAAAAHSHDGEDEAPKAEATDEAKKNAEQKDSDTTSAKRSSRSSRPAQAEKETPAPVADEPASAPSPAEPKKPRRASSSGTIVPKSSSDNGIMTFPV